MRRIEVPVLVVGGGPVGTAAALLLARHGIASLVVDRRAGPHRAPQAHVANPRTLEIFRSLGVDMTALRAAATPRADGAFVSFVTTLVGVELGRLPYERQDDDVLTVTPEPLLNLSQHRLEPILIEQLERTPGIDLRWGNEWRGLDQDAHGVTSRVCDLDGGEEYLVRSRWVLAADGAGSRVRRHLGIDMTGPDQLQSFIMIHFEADLRALVRERPAILYWVVDPDALGMFVAHHIDHTWVFMHRWDEAAEALEAFTPARCGELVRRAIGREDVPFTIRDVSPWRMTAQVAERFRDDRVFLVGDSAHRFPPSGGLGLNTGVQDAHNLAWKLAWVETERAGRSLLDTYEVERRPVAQHNADQSLLNAMKMMQAFLELGLSDDLAASRRALAETLETEAGRRRMRRAIEDQQDHFDMLGLQLGFSYEEGALVPDGSPAPLVANPVREFVPTGRPGARVAHGWVETGEGRRSLLDLLASDRFTLILGAQAAGVEAAIERTVRDEVRVLRVGRDFTDPRGEWEQVSGIGPAGALLIRPDQHVAWRTVGSVADPVARLAEVLRRVTGG